MARAARANTSLSSELAAFDLSESLLLWRRTLPTRGLLNAVTAPHLAVESTAYSVNTLPQISYRTSAEYAAAVAAARERAALKGGGGAGGTATQRRRLLEQRGGGRERQEAGQLGALITGLTSSSLV